MHLDNIALVLEGGGMRGMFSAGVFEASTRTFNARPGVTVEEDYVSRVNNIVALQYNYAQQLIARDYYRVALGRE